MFTYIQYVCSVSLTSTFSVQFKKCLENHDSSDSIVNSYGLDGLGFNLHQRQDIVLFSKYSHQHYRPMQPPIHWPSGVHSLCIQQPGCKVHHPLKQCYHRNKWSSTLTPLTWLRGTHRDKVLPLLEHLTYTEILEWCATSIFRLYSGALIASSWIILASRMLCAANSWALNSSKYTFITALHQDSSIKDSDWKSVMDTAQWPTHSPF